MNRTLKGRIFRKAVAAAILLVATAACGATTSDSERIAILLQQTKAHAVQATNDAIQLETYSMTGIPWQVHYYRLVQTGDDVNALVKDWRQLNALRDAATPEQKVLIDRLGELLSGLSGKVSTARHYLVRNQDEVNMPTFHNQVRANYAAIQRVSAAVCQCASQAKQQNLQAKADRDCPAPVE